MTALAPVLSADDLPDVELQAARLDGELYALGDAFCQIGELEGPAHRAHAVLAGRSRRLIAELRTAVWVWLGGARPAHAQFAVTPEARARLSPGRQTTVRELVFEPRDLIDLDGATVTSPLRTIIDLARYDPDVDSGVLARLTATAGLTLDDCLADLASRSGIPLKRRAHRVLDAIRSAR